MATGFESPLGIVVAPNGVVYVADSGNHVVRSISTNGIVSVIAGGVGDWGTTDGKGTEARFNCPLGLALDRDGNLFVSDSNNHTIRKIAPDRAVTTFAGVPLSDGYVDGAAARFSNPAELRFDALGNLYVADSLNNAIRKISPDGRVMTVTGFSGVAGAANGINGQATFYNPYSLAFLPDGRVAISDAYNQLIREAAMPIEVELDGRGLTWNSVAGSRYQIHFSEDLSSWFDVGDVIATGPISTFNEALNSSVRVYRIRLDTVP
jgi:DNA-binding beta-propeller fold protein YncE